MNENGTGPPWRRRNSCRPGYITWCPLLLPGPKASKSGLHSRQRHLRTHPRKVRNFAVKNRGNLLRTCSSKLNFSSKGQAPDPPPLNLRDQWLASTYEVSESEEKCCAPTVHPQSIYFLYERKIDATYYDSIEKFTRQLLF
jgi:hypothetical protein